MTRGATVNSIKNSPTMAERFYAVFLPLSEPIYYPYADQNICNMQILIAGQSKLIFLLCNNIPTTPCTTTLPPIFIVVFYRFFTKITIYMDSHNNWARFLRREHANYTTIMPIITKEIVDYK